MKRTFVLATLLFATSPLFAQYALQFGASVAAETDAVYVGEGRNILQAGSLFKYERAEDGSWVMTRAIKPSDTQNVGDGFGRAVSIAGNTMVIGAPLANAIYVFEKATDGSWAETARLTADGVALGSRVATDGIHILATAAGDRDTAASVHAWTRGESGWLTASGIESSRQGQTGLGTALALFGNVAAIGSPSSQGRKGMVETFVFADGIWAAQGALEHARGREGDAFGSSILLDSGHMVVGMPGHDTRKGAAAIFSVQIGAL